MKYIEIDATIHDVIRYNEHDAMHIINFLSILLPIVLHNRFNKTRN